ncbi:MAG: hypothetical protein KAV97_00760 [Actinomycetia bacterium]|nr:hypothetical protein [Actinomycetes bacterium]
MNLIDLLGIIENSKALNTVGTFLRWYEILALAGIVFAISEFMGHSKLRNYIFKWSNLSKYFLRLIIISILLVILANILPLFNSKLKILPYLSYPAFWELIGLTLFSIAITLILVFSLDQYRFIPNINRKNCFDFYNNLYRVVLYEQSNESLSAISIIIQKNLEKIFEYAARYDNRWNVKGSPFKSAFEKNKVPDKEHNLVNISCNIIDVLMSEKYYCQYLSENNMGLVLRIIEQTNKYELWNSCGRIFYGSLCNELFVNNQSHLSKEIEFRGVGLTKPVFKALFTSFHILDAYRPFQSFHYFMEENYQVEIINKYTKALEISLREYFKEKRSIFFAGSCNIALSVALNNLSDILYSICIRLERYENGDIYYNRYQNVIRAIETFYSGTVLGMCFYATEKHITHFSKEDLEVKERSMTRGIIEAIFQYLDALTILKNEDYARMLSTKVFWLIFSTNKEKSQVIKNMEEALLSLLKERVEENKKGGYSSMIKLLINIYGSFQYHEGVRENVKIGKYIEEEFKKNLAIDILTDKEKEKRYLPKKYTVNRKLKIIKDLHGRVIYKAK